MRSQAFRPAAALAMVVSLLAAGCAGPVVADPGWSGAPHIAWPSPIPIYVSTVRPSPEPPLPSPPPPTRPTTGGGCAGSGCGLTLAGDWDSLTAGDCIDFRQTKTELVFTRRPCTRPYDYEIYSVQLPDEATPPSPGESVADFMARTCPHALLEAYAPAFAQRHPRSPQESVTWGGGRWDKRICAIAPDVPGRSIRTP